jgi:hypothetical protein
MRFSYRAGPYKQILDMRCYGGWGPLQCSSSRAVAGEWLFWYAKRWNFGYIGTYIHCQVVDWLDRKLVNCCIDSDCWLHQPGVHAWVITVGSNYPLPHLIKSMQGSSQNLQNLLLNVIYLCLCPFSIYFWYIGMNLFKL